MTICSFCPLLCEIADNESVECRLRDQRLAAISSLDGNASALIDGRKASVEEAIQKAKEILSKSCRRTITGRIRSVEGSRAVIALASHFGAFIDPANSENAFKSIAAVQRTGMVTASLSEVRFRADCIVFIGDDTMLDLFPRIANVLLQRSATQDSMGFTPARVVLLGRWSSQTIARIREFCVDVCSVDIDVSHVPQSLFQWSRCSQETLEQSRNEASTWMSQANYLTLVWSPAGLHMPYADLWIERLLEWIAQRNEIKRCVGFPLSSDYITFQQVCTWITGFPGRVHIDDQAFLYEPSRVSTLAVEDNQNSSIALRIDESMAEVHSPRFETPSNIVVGPSLRNGEPMPRVFIPCGVAGVDHKATFFRMDASVAVEAMEEPSIQKKDGKWSLVDVLRKLAESPSC